MSKPAEEMEECPSCEGKGTEYYPTGLGIGSRIPCTDCGGKGELPASEAQEVWERNRWQRYD